MSRTTNLSSCFLKHGKHEKRFDSCVYAQPTSPQWHWRRRRTTFEQKYWANRWPLFRLYVISTNWKICTFSIISFRFLRVNATTLIDAICNFGRKLFNLEEIMGKKIWGKKTHKMKETESVNWHLHQLDVNVVELIDSSGRITFCTEREMKERKAKKKNNSFFPIVHYRCERKTNRHICCLFVFGEICDFSFFDSQLISQPKI